jgi:hypothetical protein
MSKRKLREWEIPMNLSKKEKKEFNMTTLDQLNWFAKNRRKNSCLLTYFFLYLDINN